MSNQIALFNISTREDLRFQLDFTNLDLTGRALEVEVIERSSGTTKATLTTGAGLLLTGTGKLDAVYAKGSMSGWARGEYSADVIDKTGGQFARIMAVRFVYNEPGKLVYGVKGNKATVAFGPNQAVVTATGGVGPAGATGATGSTGAAATVAVGDVAASAPGGDAEVTNVGTAGAAVFDFVLPRGEPGPPVSPGDIGTAELADAAVTAEKIDATAFADQPTAVGGVDEDYLMNALRVRNAVDDLALHETIDLPSFEAAFGDPETKLVRLKDRLFIGRDLDTNGGQDFFEEGPFDWTNDFQPAASSSSTLVSVSPIGYPGVMGASQTKDNPLEQSEGSIGILGLGVANKSGSFSAYGSLLEAYRYGNAGYTTAVECDAVSMPGSGTHASGEAYDYGTGAITTPKISPNTIINGGHITGVWVSMGRPDKTTCGDVTAAIGIINNAGLRTGVAGRAKTGIVIDQKAILGQDGSYAGVTYGDAIALGKRHRIVWVSDGSGDDPASWITSSVTAASGQAIDIAPGGIIITNVGSSAFQAVIDDIPAADGPVRLKAATSSDPARLYVGAGAGARSLEIAGYQGVVDLQGDAGIVAFRAYSTTGHVNFVQASSNPTGLGPLLSAQGTDSNIHLTLSGRGTGTVVISNLPTSASGLPPGGLWKDGSGFLRVV